MKPQAGPNTSVEKRIPAQTGEADFNGWLGFHSADALRKIKIDIKKFKIECFVD